MSVSCNEILNFVCGLSQEGRLAHDEGVIYGPEDRTADRVLVTWMPTKAAIQHAVKEKCGIIVSHEPLTFHDYFPAIAEPTPWAADKPRLALLQEAGMAVIRAHTTIDFTHVLPGFIRAVGLSESLAKDRLWSYHEENPIRVRDLAGKIRAGLGMDHLRVTGDPDRVITRIGTLIGGLGQDRHLDELEHNLIGRDIHALIVGETNDFAQRFAVDSGIVLIETCHSASENPGLRLFAADLEAHFSGAQVFFHAAVVPWITV